ncbi:MAG: peptidylprolyl isomerase [Victivallales bacterium]|nr:peptidylprolyl isomerase [Victivallales bacterium]
MIGETYISVKRINLILILFLTPVTSVLAMEKVQVLLMDGGLNSLGTVATVNGRAVTLLDVLNICGTEEKKLPYMYNKKEAQEQAYLLRQAALEKLIERKLVFCDFLSKGYRFPVGFMQKYLDKIAVAHKRPNAAALKKMIESRGENFTRFKKKAYENAAVNSMLYLKCYKDVFITPKRIYNYYKKNINKFNKSARVRLQILKVVKKGLHRNEIDSFIAKLQGKLNNPDEETFTEFAIMYSEGPNNIKGGDIGWIPVDKLRKDFAAALRGALIGETVGPVNTEEAYFFIRIKDRKNEDIVTYRNARKSIKHTLTVKQRKKEYDSYIKKLRGKADIKYF